MERFTGLLGILVLIALALLMSTDRRRISWRIVIAGVALQFVLAWLLLAFPPVVQAFELIARGVNRVIESADAGIGFVFGSLGDPGGPWGFIFAVRALSVIVFFASLMAVLYHLRVMQVVIAGLAWLLRKSMRVTGTEALVVAANVFVGQTEAPLCVKPFIERMTRSQIMTLMAGGFATIAGSVLAAYVGILGGVGPENAAARVEFAKHLLTASLLSAPAAFVIAKIIVPETEEPIDEGIHFATMEGRSLNIFDAAASGASDGVRLAINVGGMLIAFASLVALVNVPLEGLGGLIGIDDLSLQSMLGWLFTPLAWVMGVSWSDCPQFGSLLGEKLALTEFFAYKSLGDMVHAEQPVISGRTALIATYALCGFANFPSIGIQIGGLTAIAPGKRHEYVTLGLKAMIGGALASWMTASIAGLFIA